MNIITAINRIIVHHFFIIIIIKREDRCNILTQTYVTHFQHFCIGVKREHYYIILRLHYTQMLKKVYRTIFPALRDKGQKN